MSMKKQPNSIMLRLIATAISASLVAPPLTAQTAANRAAGIFADIAILGVARSTSRGNRRRRHGTDCLNRGRPFPANAGAEIIGGITCPAV